MPEVLLPKCRAAILRMLIPRKGDGVATPKLGLDQRSEFRAHRAGRDASLVTIPQPSGSFAPPYENRVMMRLR